MSHRCANKSCFVHDGEACATGLHDVTKCPHWEAPTASDEPAAPPPDCSRVLWSGSALGIADLAHLVPRARSIVVGVLGAHDAGKTTLLTGNYLQLLQGHELAGARFTGSRTLGAWESLAAWVRFDDAARSPSFPPHTPRGTGRYPGLLHVALRDKRDEFRDVLLTDAPGEWFTRWAVKEDAPDAAGARWVVSHADAFLVVADSERLCGSERGPARNSIRQLLERLSNHVGRRPTALVWAKDDHQPSQGIRAAIRRAFTEHIPHGTEVSCSTDRPHTLMSALEGVLRQAWTSPRPRPIVEPVLQHEPFAAFRGADARS